MEYLLYEVDTSIPQWDDRWEPLPLWAKNLIARGKELIAEANVPEDDVATEDKIIISLMTAGNGRFKYLKDGVEQEFFRRGMILQFLFETEEDALAFKLKWS